MYKYIILGIIVFNFVAIIACANMGARMEDISFLFQERQAITFLSALQLAIMGVLSLFVYLIKRLLHEGDARSLRLIKIWLLGFVLFAFASADEYFMMHEGIDGDIATFFWGITENPHLDGLTLALYGVVAIFLFFRFKSEILRYKEALLLFSVGGVFFLLSITLDLGTVEQFRILLEESSKFTAVGFLLSGFIVIFSDVLKELRSKLAG